jgi:enoyl-CoA hydratase
MLITHTLADDVALLTMDFGRGNAINHGFIEAFNAGLDEVAKSGARAMVLTGSGRVFCGGLDLVTIYEYDRPTMWHFVDAFDDLFRRLFSTPIPVIAAINGHAVAGGCILAMAADQRIVAPGPFQIGLNEVLLGIPFPAAAFEVAVHATPPASRTAVLLQGRRFSPEEAVRSGIVHRVAGERGALAEALDEARLFAAAGPAGARDTKADLKAPAIARIEANAYASRDRFLDRWFSADARARIGKVRDELVSKRAK